MERYVVMGVSGSGKSVVGAAFATQIGADFIDADDLHPATNIAKMAAGIPLTDTDRAPWLNAVGQAFGPRDRPLVIACSALKRGYRDAIRQAAHGPIGFLYLDGARDLVTKRLAARTEHFMPPTLLDSQFATLEPPDAEEAALRVDIDQPLEMIVAELAAHFQTGT